MGTCLHSTTDPTVRNGALRVALVTETWPPEINGVARTLAKLAAGLRARGHRVDLVRPRRSADDTPDGACGSDTETLVAGMPIPRYPELRVGLASSARLARLWTEQRPDIVHIATEGPLGVAALKAARHLDLPVSTGFHTNFDAYCRHYGFGWLRSLVAAHLRRFHNRADLTLVPTHDQARALRSAGFERVDVLARGVDTGLFNPARRSDELRRSWGAEHTTLIVAHVGRLAPEKNLDTVLAAFAAIHRRRPNARLLFVGDGPARRQLERRHPEHLFAGWRTGVDLAAHYASADLFLFPSLTETFGNVTLEALASGLPVVAYDHAAAAELVRDDVNGRLIAAGDMISFVAAAAELAASPEAIVRLRERAALSVSRLGWQQIEERFANLLRELVMRHARCQSAADALLMAPD